MRNKKLAKFIVNLFKINLIAISKDFITHHKSNIKDFSHIHKELSEIKEKLIEIEKKLSD